MTRFNPLRPAIALSLLALALSAPVMAQEQDSTPAKTEANAPPPTDPATPAPRAFEELDANSDGTIAKDEAAADPALTQAFGTLDQDADGKLTPAEYMAYKPAAP